MAPGSSDGSNGRPGDHGATADDVQPMLRRLHDHLAATAELPVETEVSRWLGEAEAVASDVAEGAPPRSAVETRVRQVRELLSHVEGTGHGGADEHVAAARELAAAIQQEVTDGP